MGDFQKKSLTQFLYKISSTQKLEPLDKVAVEDPNIKLPLRFDSYSESIRGHIRNFLEATSTVKALPLFTKLWERKLLICGRERSSFKMHHRCSLGDACVHVFCLMLY